MVVNDFNELVDKSLRFVVCEYMWAYTRKL